MMASQQKEFQTPVCNMRAKFEDKQIYTITSDDLLISKKHINTETWGVAMSETQSLDYDIYVSIEFDNNHFVILLSKNLINYLVHEYNVKNIDDIIGLKIKFIDNNLTLYVIFNRMNRRKVMASAICVLSGSLLLKNNNKQVLSTNINIVEKDEIFEINKGFDKEEKSRIA